MPNREEQHHRSAREVPPVGRPRGAIWRSLQADGIVWEGQVLLVGGDVDLAARLIVTHRRVVFVRGGELVLEIPRGWLRPEPVLRRDGVLDLFVAIPGGNPFDEPLTVPLRMREGPAAAGYIIAMLAPGGVRRITPDSLTGMDRAREATPPPRYGGFWDDVDDESALGPDALVANGAPSAVPGDDASAQRGWSPIDPPDRVLRLPSTPPKRTNSSDFPITGLQPRDQRRSPWRLLLRLGALTLLLAMAAALGAGRLDAILPQSGTQAILTAPTPTRAAAEAPSEGQGAALSPTDAAALQIGVGGESEETTEEAGTPAAALTAASTAAAAAPRASTPGLAEEPTTAAIPTPAPTSTPVAAPTATPLPSPTVLPAAVSEEEASPTVATTNLPTLAQPAAVSSDEAPAQEIVVGPLRLAIATALRAESLPRYGLPPGSGEWVLMIVDVTNEGAKPATMAMADFRLFDRGTGNVVDLDSGTNVIATLAGMDPPWSASDVIALDPGDTTRALILYLLPSGSTDDLALIVGQSSIDVAPSLAAKKATPADTPELVQATVTGVVDGGRIAVDIPGFQSENVQYLGLQAPATGACFAPDATAANAQLVDGQQVWLEREATDRTTDGALLRDVWVGGANGERALVAARLIEAGAALPMPSAPDTRYEAWLAASAALARSNAAGLWGACPEASPNG